MKDAIPTMTADEEQATAGGSMNAKPPRIAAPPAPAEHRGLDHKGVMRACIQEIHFCIDDYGPPIDPAKLEER